MKTTLGILLFLFVFSTYTSLNSQTLSWNGFPNGGSSFTTGIMTATVTSSAPGFQNGTPRFISGTTNGGGYCSLANSLEFEQMFGNITNAHVTLTLDFTSGGTTSGICGNISFKIKDINSDESYQTFADWVEINATDGNNGAIAVANITATGGANKTVTTSGNTRIVRGHSNSGYLSRNTTACDDVTFTISSPSGGTLKSITLKYHPDYTACPNCYYNFTGPNRPAYQYISIGPITVTNNSTVPTITASGPTTFCQGGSVTLTSSSTSGNTWSNGATTQSISVTQSGSYTVSTGACGGTSTATTVTVNPSPSVPTITTSGSTTICQGSSVTLTSSSSSGNTWSNGATTQSIVVSNAGTYSVSVSNGSCSSNSAPVTVVVNNTPIISNKLSTICSGSNYSLSPAAGDNVPSGTVYSWSFVNNASLSGASNGSNLNNFSQTLTNTSLLPQSIVYTVTPTSGTCNGQSFNVTIRVNAPLNGGTISSNQTICPNQTPNLLTNIQSATGGSGLGLTNTVQIGSQIWMNTNLDVLNYTDGQLIGTDFTQAAGAYTWYNNDQPTYGVYGPLYNWFAVNTQKLCPSGWKVPTNSDWLTLMNFVGTNQGNKLKSCRQVNSPLGGNCNVTALPRWDSHTSQFGTDNFGFAALPAGRREISNFLYTGTRATFWSADNYTPGINGSSHYVNLAVNLATAEYSDFIDIYTSNRWALSVRCLADNTNNINNSYSYQWQQDVGCTGNWVNISGATSSTYQPTALTQTTCFRRVTVDASCGNAFSNVVTITVNNISTPTITSNGSNTICQGESITLTSSPSDNYLWSTGATTQAVNVVNAGTYSVTITSSNGCSASSATTTISVNSIPSTPMVTASGATTFCQGGSVTLTSSATSGNTWSNGATTQAITVTQSGTYNVTVGSGTCTSTSASTVVTVNPSPSTPTVTASGATTFCQGGSVTLTSSATSGNTWSNGATTQAITVTQSGTYTVTVGSGTCTSTSASTVVTVNPSPSTPTVTASGATTFCQGGSVTLTSSATSGNTWSNGATTQAITVTQSGTYTVTVGSGTCTSTSASILVTVDNTFQVGLNSASICIGESATLSATPSIPGGTYNWSPIFSSSQSLIVSPSNTTTYSVTYTIGGCSASTSSTVTVSQAPQASFTMYPGYISSNPQCITFTNTSLNASYYSWNFGNGLVSNETNEIVCFSNSSGSGYTIQLTAYSNLGCSTTYQLGLSVKEDGLYYVPNSFTPDGDEYNNVFLPIFVSGFDPYNYTLEIFNRWGELLFESNDHTKGWDGSLGTTGQKVQDGVYIWKIKFKKPSTDDRIELHGHVSLIR